MRSRQYTIQLRRVKKTQAYIVYADRTVEVGYLENDQFVRSLTTTPTRAYVADMLQMGRDLGYTIERRFL